MDNNGTSVNDDELNQMIANLQNKPAVAPPAIVSSSGVPITPAVNPAPVANPGSAVPAAPVFPPVAVPPIAPNPVVAAPSPNSVAVLPANTELENIKKDALSELRPLVDKLDLPAEEKFDTLLLLIRSTDDPSLIAPAHAAAQAIPDETRRAQALLDVIKEIDFFGQSSSK